MFNLLILITILWLHKKKLLLVGNTLKYIFEKGHDCNILSNDSEKELYLCVCVCVCVCVHMCK